MEELIVEDKKLEVLAAEVAKVVVDKIQVLIEVLKCMEPTQLRELADIIETEKNTNK